MSAVPSPSVAEATSPELPTWQASCGGTRPTFGVTFSESIENAPTLRETARIWLLHNERVGRAHPLDERAYMVEIVRSRRVLRILELVHVRRGWVPESVVACDADVKKLANSPLSCAPRVVAADGESYEQEPVQEGPELGIAVVIQQVRVSRCGVLLPGRRLLTLRSDVWPVTTYTRSETSPEEGQLVSIVVGKHRHQEFFPMEYAGTS